MIAAFGLPDEPEPSLLAIRDSAVLAVHLTRLKPDGSGKAGTDADKLTIGRGALGAPIVIAPPNLGLAITEGIEDAFSVHAATGLGVWAAGSAGRMPALADSSPDYIDCVTDLIDPLDDRLQLPGGQNVALLLRAAAGPARRRQSFAQFDLGRMYASGQESTKILPKRRSGIAWPPIRAIRMHRPTLASCMSMAKGSLRTTPRR